jgi:hypothetical protein
MLITAVSVLALAATASAHRSASEPFPEPVPTSPECERQAFNVLGSGFRSEPPGSLTRFRIIGVLGFVERECGTRQARIAVFDRRAGTQEAFRTSRWTAWTPARRFVRVVRTSQYRCGFFRAVYVQVLYGDIIRTFTRRGSRGC